MKDLERIYQLILAEKKKVLTELERIDRELGELGTEQKSIVIKMIKGKKYYYEQWREAGKLKYKCLGKVYPGAVYQEEKEISRRKELLAQRKEQQLLCEQLQWTLQRMEKQRMEESILQDYSFEVFWRDEITARVAVKGSRVHVSRYCKHPLKQLFAQEKMTRHQLNKILEMRCFEKGRGDIRQILNRFGLKEYNPQELVRKTHGVSYNDYIWFRFPGEKLTAKDVLVR
ncbi:MAG: hypothetical protein K2K56_14015 [Lachnospiraceae bacterium]|nr:hypothetical protein [Lachnospiraceae bacterium]